VLNDTQHAAVAQVAFVLVTFVWCLLLQLVQGLLPWLFGCDDLRSGQLREAEQPIIIIIIMLPIKP
jgi:hypothetical protein